MTQEEKDLLLKDLCTRLPYGVLCNVNYMINNETTDYEDIPSETDDKLLNVDTENFLIYTDWLREYVPIEDCKPYLRPMSSMTEEEKKKVHYFVENHKYGNCSRSGAISDYLNSIHIDYRGLIEKGLALPAPKGMYKEGDVE